MAAAGSWGEPEAVVVVMLAEFADHGQALIGGRHRRMVGLGHEEVGDQRQRGLAAEIGASKLCPGLGFGLTHLAMAHGQSGEAFDHGADRAGHGRRGQEDEERDKDETPGRGLL